MIYIIGVAHRAQAVKPETELSEAQQAFSRCLASAVKTFHPAIIAEEYSEEALGNDRSLAKELAAAKGIEHRFCDPTSEERKKMEYKDRQSIELEMFMSDEEGLSNDEISAKAGAVEIARYFPLREQFWLDRLEDFIERDVVFVCGEAHIESFGELLDSKKIRYTVVERGIGVTAEDTRRFQVAVDYLKAHPDIVS